MMGYTDTKAVTVRQSTGAGLTYAGMGCVKLCFEGLPVGRQQFRDPASRMSVDPVQDIFDVEEWIDPAQLTTADQTIVDRCTLPAFITSGKQPVLAAKRYFANCAFR